MSRDKQDDGNEVLSHLEGGVVIFDKPPDEAQTARENRGRQQHDFLRTQARTNVVMAIFSGLLFAATVATIAIGLWQAKISQTASQAATKSADAASQSTYLACLTAQATQATLAEMQAGTADSHASSIAVLQEAKAGIVANRAIVSVLTHFPQPGELVTDVLAIPFSMRNDGKSEATDVDLKLNGSLLLRGETLHFGHPKDSLLTGKRFPANFEYPEPIKSNTYHPITVAIPLKRLNGEQVKASSVEGTEFLNGGAGEAFVYGLLSYKDTFGRYQSEFCTPQYIMRSGTTRVQSANEKLCAEHNHDAEFYLSLPQATPTSSKNSTKIEPIECVKP